MDIETTPTHARARLRLAATLAIGLSLGLVGGIACGGTTDNGGKCTTNADCKSGETCDTLAGTCSCDPNAVQDTCTAADAKTVCRAATKRCEPFCQADADCNKGETCDTANGVCKCTVGASPDTCTQADSNAVCHIDTARCETTCADDSGCTSPLKCDPATKVCRDPSKFQAVDCTAAGATCESGKHCNTATKACDADCTATSCGDAEHCDATSKACVAGCDATSCETGKHCSAVTTACVADCTTEVCVAAGQVCNATTKECEAAQQTTCDSNAAQPSACAQGEICANSNVCETIPAPTCNNLDTHSDLGTTGPIIYSVVAGSRTQDANFCPSSSAPERAKAHVMAYDKNAAFPADKTGLEVHYVKSDGSEGTPTITGYTGAGSHNAEFDLNFCVPTGQTFTIGVHFLQGNGFCATLTP